MLVGTEQEYGIIDLDGGSATPMALSDEVVRAYVDESSAPSVGFDYGSETPLDDAWGYQMARESADWDLRTDEHRAANRMLTSGARWYVDHAHPEYSGPECASWAEAVAAEIAGDRIAHQATLDAASATGRRMALFKNNTDGKGQSYGSHENYVVDREVPFERLVAVMTPLLVSRTVVCGAGRVGIGRAGERPGFQLGQRPDFFEREVGIETTVRRPLINTRDEPHAARQWRRLHVITGDANRCQVALWLKVGMASMAIALASAGWEPPFRLARPVEAFASISHDRSLRQGVALDDGRTITALEMQGEFLAAARQLCARTPVVEGEDDDLLDCWEDTVMLLGRDPAACADRLDWVAKVGLMERLRERHGLAWDAPELAALDLRWADVDPARSPASFLEARGQLLTVVEDEQIEWLRTHAPSTRAAVRSRLLREHGESIVGMNWDRVRVRAASGAIRSVDLPDPMSDAWEPVAAALA